MPDSEMMLEAAAEIRGLRRRLEVLEAKDRVFEGMMAALHSSPPYAGMGAVEDLAWKLEQRAAVIKAEAAKIAQFDIAPPEPESVA